MAARKRYSITITSGEKKLQANHVALFVPELAAVSAAVEAALKANFEDVEVKIVGDANLQVWCGLAEKGLGGSARLCEVGGVPYMMDPKYQHTTFQLPDVAAACGMPGPALIIGAAAASTKVVGRNAELIPHTVIPGPRHTRYACIDYPLDDSSDEEDDDELDSRGHGRMSSEEIDMAAISAADSRAGYAEPRRDIFPAEKRKSLSRSAERSGAASPVLPTEAASEKSREDVTADDVKDAEDIGRDPRMVPIVSSYPSEETGCLANLFLCDGKQAPLIYVKAKKRTGELNFSNCVREGFKGVDGVGGDKQIGAGGVFKVNKGKVRAHIMPDFLKEKTAEDDEEAVKKWLRWYEFGPDLLMFSCILTDDPTPDKRLHLRLEHTHFYSTSKTKPHEGGHYHFDVTPEEVEYEGYFSLAEFVYRVEDARFNIDQEEAKAKGESATV
jgi:hypothetical protein